MTEQEQMCVSSSDDDGVSVDVLGSVAAIRRRPKMYLGDVGGPGLERLVTTVVSRLLESSDGVDGAIRVRLHADGSVTVADVDGRSKPVTPSEVTDSATENVHESNTDATLSLVVINALSERFQLEQWVNGTPERRCFRRGEPHRGRPRRILGVDGATLIHFMPDPEIFGDLSLPFDMLAEALEVVAQRSEGVGTIFLEDNRSGRRREIHA